MCRFSVHARGRGGERRGDGEARGGESTKVRERRGRGGEISQLVGMESQGVRQGGGVGERGQDGEAVNGEEGKKRRGRRGKGRGDFTDGEW